VSACAEVIPLQLIEAFLVYLTTQLGIHLIVIDLI